MPTDKGSCRGQLVQQVVESPFRFASTLGPLGDAPVVANQRDATDDLGIGESDLILSNFLNKFGLQGFGGNGGWHGKSS